MKTSRNVSIASSGGDTGNQPSQNKAAQDMKLPGADSSSSSKVVEAADKSVVNNDSSIASVAQV